MRLKKTKKSTRSSYLFSLLPIFMITICIIPYNENQYIGVALFTILLSVFFACITSIISYKKHDKYAYAFLLLTLVSGILAVIFKLI